MSELAGLQNEVSARDGAVPAMLPASAYTSDEVLAWERRNLFAAGWTCLGRLDELLPTDPAKTQRAVMVGDVSALLTRDGQASDPGQVRMFANTCRHRAHELLPDGGTSARRSIICPYHAWSFDLAGDLVAAPGYRGEPGFEPSEYSLVELPVAVWCGWDFGHAAHRLGDPDVVPFETWIGELAGIVEPYDPASLVLAERHSYEIAANWKIVAENYHECYHCPLIHPELCQVTPPTSGDNYDLPGAWVGGSMVLREGMATMSMTGESGGHPIPGVSPTAVEYLHVLPNLLISPHPDYVMTHRLVPLAPGRTWIECSWYLVPNEDGTVPDPTYAVEFWDLTNRQDWAACESVQRGLESPHYAPGPFSPSEDAVERFVALISRAYVGKSLHDYRHKEVVG